MRAKGAGTEGGRAVPGTNLGIFCQRGIFIVFFFFVSVLDCFVFLCVYVSVVRLRSIRKRVRHRAVKF